MRQALSLTHLALDRMAAMLHADNIFKRILLNGNVRILIQIFTEICSYGGPIDNNSA